MPEIEIFYGRSSFKIDLHQQVEILIPPICHQPSVEGKILLETTLKSSSWHFENFLKGGKKLLIIIPDRTRKCGLDKIIPSVLKIICDAGYRKSDLSILVANGIHQRAGSNYYSELLNRETVSGIQIVEHNCDGNNVLVGVTSRATPVELNQMLITADRILTIGGMVPHYFAGFGGGPKLILPGCASRRCIEKNHSLSLDPVQDYNPNCRPGKIEGNPVIQDIIESASFLPPVYQIGLILNHKGDFIQICAGELVETYKKMCAEALKLFSININSEPEALLISAGGHPRDIDLLQAHKSLFEAEFILKKGGTIFFFAECPEAIGSANLETLLELKTVEKIRAYLQSKPIINGLSALSLMKLGQEYDVRIFSELSDRTLNVLNFKRLSNFNEVTENIAKTISADGKVYFIPWGALTMVNMLSCQRTEI